ncbi:unnamed protein product [Commensalibacter communis]|nr:unnamed protein product [Commensalibacter communis]
MLTLMFIEYAVEPLYYDHRINLYEDGGNFSTASMAYYVCSGFFGNGFDIILQKFQDAMRHKTPATVVSLIASVLAVDWRSLSEVLGPLALRHPDCIDAIMNPNTSTDAAFIILKALISRTEQMSNEPYSIKHDRSDNLLQYNHYLTTLINCKENAKFKGSEIASIQFPLKLKNVNQVDSKLSPSVQLCDVLIGRTISDIREFAENKSSSTCSVLNLYSDDQLIYFVPNIDFEQQKKFRSGSQGNELIDFVAKQFHKSVG